MKIVFTSCMDAKWDDRQKVWDEVAKHNPDLLLLLGDTIYMDFGLTLGAPRDWSYQEFAQEMHESYAKQWAVKSFRQAIAAAGSVGVIWDDHDFAWNNSCGDGDGGRDTVPPAKQRIARALFQQFRKQVETRPAPADYPDLPRLETLLAGPLAGIEYTLDRGIVRCVMTDGRTFRQSPNKERTTFLLGRSQLEWVKNKIEAWPDVVLLCSGSTLSAGGENWSQYADFELLMSKRFRRVIVLSGDVHYNDYFPHVRGDYELREAVSSGAARPGPGGDSGNFGLIELADRNGVIVRLYEFDKLKREYVIDFNKVVSPDDPVPI